MVWDLFRDSTFGQLVRVASGGRIFPYPEERDNALWKKYINEEKSGYLAHHGTTDPPQEGEDASSARGRRSGEANQPNSTPSSSHTRIAEDDEKKEGEFNEASGVRVDPEKGKDKHVVDWYGPDDPEVCCAYFSSHYRP